MGDPGVGLATAIEAVREQLIAAQAESDSKGLSFTVGKVVVELAGELRTTGGTGVGVKFWVVNIDAKGERSSAATHKVSVELIPVGPGGTSWSVHDADTAGPTPQ